MTASLHKLTAGSGYDYLTRQVAAHDVTEKGHASLASYYSEAGEVPGVWRGNGVAGLGDLAVGDVVTEEQMQALFGSGFHPNMKARLAALPPHTTAKMIEDAARLGVPFKVFKAATEFRLEVEERSAAWLRSQRLAPSAVVPVGVRAEIVNSVARERFQERLARDPNDDELAAEVTRLTSNPTTACAGYDLTFTPVKSVSALWAVAPLPTAAAIERAHNAAVDDALRFLEEHALYSRGGTNGVRQIDVHGLVAASFTHRDSRAGDPNLHTHVAIANKVQGLDGKWRAIDGRLIYKANVSASEIYNTQLEAHLTQLVGVRFVERAASGRGKRAIREIEAIPQELMESWSSRRALIEARQAELAADFQRTHHRPPTPAEAIRLAQQATLETRERKHEARSLENQRKLWREQADRVLGRGGVDTMVQAALRQGTHRESPLPAQLNDVAAGIVARVAQDRATWQVWHLRAEAARRAREWATTPQESERLVEELLSRAITLSTPLGRVDDGIEEPPELRRADGTSMYVVAGAQRFTSEAVLAAERLILEAAGSHAGLIVDEQSVEMALLESVANGLTLTSGQANLVRDMATSGHQVQLALAPAGTGKTTAMRVLARAWKEAGGEVLGLAPSAVAAAELRDAVGQATTVAQLVWDLHNGRRTACDARIGPGTLLILDEAGMTDTMSLAALVSYAQDRGASVRLVGDDQQLAAIGAGGVLRDIQRTHGAVELTEIMRFSDAGEKAASLALRQGDPEALGWYLDHQRIHAGSTESALEGALGAWLTDVTAGLDSIMLAGTRDAVAELNRRARLERNRDDDGLTSALSDGNIASTGDIVLTRLNDARLRLSATDWVKNGDRWIVEDVHTDGALAVRHRESGLRTQLPARYVAEHVQLGYATTVHSAQGMTVDSSHTVIIGNETRQQLYVGASRGRQANHLWVVVVGQGDEHTAFTAETLRPPSAAQVLDGVLARDGSSRSVATENFDAAQPAAQLKTATDRYHDALTTALENLNGEAIQRLEDGANAIVTGLTDAAAWPTLRQRLVQHSEGRDALQELQLLATEHQLDEAADPAAMLAALIPEPGGGPLPWLPAIPASVHADPTWGPYLRLRAGRVQALAAEVHTGATSEDAARWAPIRDGLSPKLLSEVAVWRAAQGVAPTDRRPTGEPVLGGAAARYQQSLDATLRSVVPLLGTAQLSQAGLGFENDSALPSLARQLAQLESEGTDVVETVQRALAQGQLPAERSAAALRWRIAELADTDKARKEDPAQELVRHERWASTVNPELRGSPQWTTVRGCLRNLETSGTDLEALLPHLRGKNPREIRASLMRLLAARGRDQEEPSGRPAMPPSPTQQLAPHR